MPEPFNDCLNADIASVFFGEFSEPITIEGKAFSIIFDRQVEVVNDDGTLDMVAYAITAKADDVERDTVFIREDERRWKVGRLLERSPDGRIKTWEVMPDAGI